MGKFPWRHLLRTEILVGSKNGVGESQIRECHFDSKERIQSCSL